MIDRLVWDQSPRNRWERILMTENSTDPHLDPIAQNTEAMLAFHEHEKDTLGRHHNLLVSFSETIGSPIFLAATVLFVAIWITANLVLLQHGHKDIDPPPFQILQGILGLAALIVTIVVLIKQNLLGKMEERRSHLELQVNLLTEQKVTKLITLIEELRRDLPMIEDRYDAQAAAYQVPTDPETVLKVLDEKKDPKA